MSDSVRPHRQQPTRLPRPRDSPGKNTEVGCHFLLQYMKVKSESEVTQSCPTPRDPMDCSLPGSSIHGTLQARVLERIAIAFSSVCVFSHQSSLRISEAGTVTLSNLQRWKMTLNLIPELVLLTPRWHSYSILFNK